MTEKPDHDLLPKERATEDAPDDNGKSNEKT
jgi:hypothetical protein